MANIKTREVNKGSIKGIDRAKNLSDRLMHAGVRTKDEVYQIGSREDKNETCFLLEGYTLKARILKDGDYLQHS